MLRLIARYADAWNTAWYGLPDERLRQRLVDMNAALLAEDRDPVTLRRTVGMDCVSTGRVDQLARAIDAYERLGIDDLIIGLQPRSRPALDQLARAIELHGRAPAVPSDSLRRGAPVRPG
jgi:alkanesulfonate monooxygenase SsuD/methylene tetrahydromethanopterin reductase-like flavin-dependent oxidoreductase (luciferase family)